ncbi:NAD(P)H-dependent glycerol-3-phosphate dehydrogenase [Brucella abortus]|nr:NAD(P)H-dependent glycerol-3-phosphate dehydrogenase [Brucella abortus]
MGRGYGASAQAALVTRGFAELRRIGQAMSARPETIMGLSGLGDLMLTCSSSQSRNYSYGLALGRGEDLTSRPLAEGVATAPIAAELCRKHNISAPIIDAVGALLDGKITIDEAVTASSQPTTQDRGLKCCLPSCAMTSPTICKCVSIPARRIWTI